MCENHKDRRPRKGSVSLKDRQQCIVINELLAFAFDEAGRSPVATVKSAILKFYSANSIAAAKIMLWENYSSTLPPMGPRKDTAKRTAADAEVDDIQNG